MGSTLVVQSVMVVTATILVVHAAVLRCQNPTKLRLKAIYQVFVLGSRDNLDLCTLPADLFGVIGHFT